jgi:hypothetical protein
MYNNFPSFHSWTFSSFTIDSLKCGNRVEMKRSCVLYVTISVIIYRPIARCVLSLELSLLSVVVMWMCIRYIVGLPSHCVFVAQILWYGLLRQRRKEWVDQISRTSGLHIKNLEVLGVFWKWKFENWLLVPSYLSIHLPYNRIQTIWPILRKI